MPGSTLEIGVNPRALTVKRMLADPDFQRYQKADPKGAHELLEAATIGERLPIAPLSPGVTTGPGGTLAFAKGKTTAELTREQKLSLQSRQIVNLVDEMENLWNERLKKRFDSGDLSNFGQGARYVYPSYYNTKVDPDVAAWMVKSGQLSQMVNSFYAQSSGGRGGVQAYQQITTPHIPSPPASLLDLTGTPERRQWNLEEQASWLPEVRLNVLLSQEERGVETYALPTNKPDPVGDAMRKYGVK